MSDESTDLQTPERSPAPVQVRQNEKGWSFANGDRVAGPYKRKQLLDVEFERQLSLELGVSRKDAAIAMLGVEPLAPPIEKEFTLEHGKLSLFLDRDRTPTVSPVDISQDYVFQLAYMPCEIELPPRKEGGASRIESIEHPFIVYDYKGKRGLAPIDRNRAEVGKDKDLFHVRSPQPLPSMIGPRTVRAFLEGEEVDDPPSLYEQALSYLKRKSDQDQDCYYTVSTIHGLGTHFLEAFDVYPYLRFFGPPDCGKTNTNYTVGSIAFHPVATPDISDPSFYRLREATHFTMSLDERNLKRKQESQLPDLLNNAYKRGGSVIRSDKDQFGNIVPRVFDVYGGMIYSGVHDLPYMTETRSLGIPMLRSLESRFSAEDEPLWWKPEPTEIREKNYLFRLTNGRRAREIYQRLKPKDYGIMNRQWELARPLIATALLYGLDVVHELKEAPF